jgi:hypothetical protein
MLAQEPERTDMTTPYVKPQSGEILRKTLAYCYGATIMTKTELLKAFELAEQDHELKGSLRVSVLDRYRELLSMSKSPTKKPRKSRSKKTKARAEIAAPAE